MRIPDPAAGIMATVLTILEEFSFFDIQGKQPVSLNGGRESWFPAYRVYASEGIEENAS